MEKAQRLLEIVEMIKELQKEEKELKADFVETLGYGSFDLNGVNLMISEGTRTNYKGKDLFSEYVKIAGEDAASKYVSKTSYNMVKVKESKTALKAS